MHALMRFGTAFGGYKMMENYPEPECGPEDIIVKIRAAAICGADMKHWGVDTGYDDTNCPPDQQKSLLQAAVYKVLVSADDYRIIFNWHMCGGDEPPHPVCQSVPRISRK